MADNNAETMTTNEGGPAIASLSRHAICRATVNGIDYFYIDSHPHAPRGPADVDDADADADADAVPTDTILFAHGFPDLASSWDGVIDIMRSTYRCVAPFLRGYYPTAMVDDGDYSLASIAADTTALMTYLRVDTYTMCGQDFGASLAYTAAARYPDRVTRLVTVAIPHSRFISLYPGTLWRARHFITFRNEKKSVPQTLHNNCAYLETLFKRWSPSMGDTLALQLQRTKTTFALPGRCAAALNWYWSLFRKTNARAVDSALPTMPFLAIAGAEDGAVNMKGHNAFRVMERALTSSSSSSSSPFQLVILDGGGHFVQAEQPKAFAAALSTWLAATPPASSKTPSAAATATPTSEAAQATQAVTPEPEPAEATADSAVTADPAATSE